MGKSLLIVESPTKARTLSRYLGDRFDIRASVGHVKDLPANELGINIENKRKAAAQADSIYLAPDPDREGEAIAWHIAEELRSSKKEIYRVLFNELTRNAIENALKQPGELHQHKFEAQLARRLLDRLVGYQISPILWDKIRRGLSAGRVQSVTLRLICEREHEILAFDSEEYWTITALLEGEVKPQIEARLWGKAGKRVKIVNQEQASALVTVLEQASYQIEKVEKKKRTRSPAPPFITSTLQQEAARKLRYTAQRTMAIAQRLYEGVELGKEGAVGLITYMRTDSTRLAKEAVTAARTWIRDNLGTEYVPKKAPVYRSRKGTQDAHEAIRPTSVTRTPEQMAASLKKDELALYELIWKRFVASQMSPAQLDQTIMHIAAGELMLRASGTVLRFPGFMQIYIEGSDNGEGGLEEGSKLPDLEEGKSLKLVKGTQTTLHPAATALHGSLADKRTGRERYWPAKHLCQYYAGYSEKGIYHQGKETIQANRAGDAGE
jgi:DNA topoisomerase-1